MAKTNGNTEKTEGSWVSWADFLGTAGNGGSWSKNTLLTFLTEYRDSILMSDSVDLLVLLRKMGLEYRIKSNAKFKGIIVDEPGSEEREENINALIDEIEGKSEEEFDEEGENADDFEVEEVDVDENTNIEDDIVVNLPKEKILKWMKLDNEYLHLETLNDEDFQYLVMSHVNKLWNYLINDVITIEDINDNCYPSIKESFCKEYNAVMDMTNPTDYCFNSPLNDMQKLIAYRLKVQKKYGNWSKPGMGKTLSGIFAGRYVEAKNTLIITFNSTISGWKECLDKDSNKRYFNNCNFYSKKDLKTVTFEDGKYNYLVLNYEFFQNGQRAENRLSDFLKRNRIDYVVLDEVQSVKQREEDITMNIDQELEEGLLSRRRHLIVKFINDIFAVNSEAYFLVMTATPLINNLIESKKLFELLTGKNFNELGTNKTSVNDAVQHHKQIKLNGFRYSPLQTRVKVSDNIVKSSMTIDGNKLECVETVVDVNGADLYEELKGVKNVLLLEQILLNHKLEGVSQYIRKGTIIYTSLVDGVVSEIGKFVKEQKKLKIGLYTGREDSNERDAVKKAFKEGRIDVLIGSEPIGTGVDGLQECCDNLILMSLPWTHSEYEQLMYRIFRQGSKYKTVNIVIPNIFIDYEENGESRVWSWDKHKLNIIRFKRDLFGIVVDGVIPEGIVTNLTKVRKESFNSLEKAIESVKAGLTTKEREEIEKKYLEFKQIDSYRRSISKIGEFNSLWNRRKSKNNFEEIQSDPEIWKEYHKYVRKVRENESKEETPMYVIANKINKLNKSNLTVVDFGCGDNLMKNEIKNKVVSLDMGKNDDDDTVIICDLSSVPLEDASVHIGVFSLSLMGRNYADFLIEAKRVLVTGGYLFIAEPYNRWNNGDDEEEGMNELKAEVENAGFVVREVIKNGKYFYIDAVNAL